jgi:hypothetical protein
MAFHGSAPVTPGDIYAWNRAGHITLHKLGALVTGSRELLRAQLTGVEPNPTRVGIAGDLISGAKGIADFVNELRGADSAP